MSAGVSEAMPGNSGSVARPATAAFDDSHADGQFNDGKAPDAFRTIGEVSRALAIRAHVLRYWEEQFPMLRPLKRGGGRRYYRQRDIEMVRTIDRLVHREGFTLRGARRFLESCGEGEGGEAADMKPANNGAAHSSAPHAAQLVTRLKALRARLAQALDAD